MRTFLCLAFLVGGFAVATADPSFALNGAPDNEVDAYGYYYAVTGGIQPSNTTRNGNNGSGGVFRYLYDDPYWGSTPGVWLKDDWFPQNAGLAMTLFNGSNIVYDNNGLENGTYDPTYYDPQSPYPGLYCGYSSHANFDFIYASYFKLDQETTLDRLVGYFRNTLDIEHHTFLMNIWSELDDGSLLPTNTGSFRGNVFSSTSSLGTFSTSDTGVNLGYTYYNQDEGTNVAPRDIYRLEFRLNNPITLAAGDYYFSHSATPVVPEPFTLALGLAGLGIALRRRNKA